jgi:uroporphyrin-3 C-methyltransferase
MADDKTPSNDHPKSDKSNSEISKDVKRSSQGDSKTGDDSKPTPLLTEVSSTQPPLSDKPKPEPSSQADTKTDKASANAAELFGQKAMPKMAAKTSKKNTLSYGLVVLLLIAALLVSGWSVYQQMMFDQQWTAMQSKVDQQMKDQLQLIQQATQNSQASLNALNQTQIQVNQNSQKSQQITDSLFSTQERLKDISGRKKQDWMLAEAAYLIKLAQLQLTLQKDTSTAMQLLKTADSRILEIADDSLLPIRNGIAQDLSNLSLVMVPDITGISLQLNAIGQQIPSLTISALQFTPLKENLERPDGNDENDGFELSTIYNNFLNDFVVVKDHSEPVKPLMSEQQRVNLSDNLLLAIQQSQVALLKGNEVLYRMNLEKTILWLNTFYIKDNNVKAITDQLTQLITQPVEVKLPTSLNAKRALKQVSEQQLYRWLDNSSSNQGVLPADDIVDPSIVDSSTDKNAEQKKDGETDQ